MQSNQPVMQRRDQCPSCQFSTSTQLCSEPYTSLGVKNYLAAHYDGRASNDVYAYQYELVQCPNCRLAYQTNVPANSLLTDIYDRWCLRSEPQQLPPDRALDNFRDMAEQVLFTIQHLGLPPHAVNVLDFGFGWAEFARMAMAYGCNVAGIELSQERIEHARSIGVTVLDFADLPVKKFHLINTEQVFEHLIQPRETLQRLVGALADDGILKISVPNAKAVVRKMARGVSFGALSRAEIMPIAPLEHVNAFDYNSLVALGQEVGLTPLRPSLRQMYNSSSGYLDGWNALRLLVRPLYRHVFPKSTFVYFVRG